MDLAGWLAKTREEPVDRRRPIVDAHHHLWPDADNTTAASYLLEDYFADATAGHNVTQSVFVECRTSYRTAGPEELRPVGETAFAAAAAKRSDDGPVRVGAIVAFADLRLGIVLDDVLDAHDEAGGGRFRGIRQSDAWGAASAIAAGRAPGPPALLAEEAFARGVARLGERGYSFDGWAFHPHLDYFVRVADRAPGTTLVLNHLGAPLGLGPYRDGDGVRVVWRAGMERLAARPNVVVKLGGIGMDRLFGTGWSKRQRPPGSDEVAAYWSDDVRFCIDTFGPSRCMFESNYPVDRVSIGYTVLWNAFQKIAAAYSDTEQDALFAGTASRVYRLAPGRG